jgi:hypothetical protein
MTFAGGVSYRSFRVWQRNADVFLRLWHAELVWPVVEPILIILALGLGLGTFVELTGNQTYMEFLAPGILAVYPMWAAVGECGWGSYVRMSMQRTFDAIIATPVNLEDVIAAEILWGTTRALMGLHALVQPGGLAPGGACAACGGAPGDHVRIDLHVLHLDGLLPELPELLLQPGGDAHVLAGRGVLPPG